MIKAKKELWIGRKSKQKLDPFLLRFYKIFKYLLKGEGFDKYEKEEDIYRYFLRKPIPFKIICKLLQLNSKKYISSPKVLNTNDDHLKHVIDYTLNQIVVNNVIGSNRRMQNYYQLAQCYLKGKFPNKKILIVGPKFITELFLAWTYGFKWENIFAIDIISNHPKIELMDVDHLKFKNLKFDCISMANVFGYNKDPEGCIKGISDYLNQDGILVFNSSLLKDNLEGTPLSSKLSNSKLKDLLVKYSFDVISTEITKDNETGVSSIWVARKIN